MLKTLVKADFAKLMSLIGRFFQIRDDYQNLMSRDVSRISHFFHLSFPSFAAFCSELTLDLVHQPEGFL